MLGKLLEEEVAVVTEVDCGTGRAIRSSSFRGLKGLLALVLYWEMKEMIKGILSWSLQF